MAKVVILRIVSMVFAVLTIFAVWVFFASFTASSGGFLDLRNWAQYISGGAAVVSGTLSGVLWQLAGRKK